MGKFFNDINKLLISKPKMYQYGFFNDEEKGLIDEVVKNYIHPNPVLRCKQFVKLKKVKPKQFDFWNLDWQDIILLKKARQANDLLEIIKLIYQISEKQLLKLDVLNVFSSYKWVIAELDKISIAEEERLQSELTDEEIEAGAEELQEYGYYNSLKAMCPDLLNQDKYLKLPYSIVFREMAHAKLLNDINKKYQENAARKNKSNRPGF